MRTIEVCKEDIKKIGGSAHEKDGFLTIICDINTSNIEEIFLREILKCFGDEYYITESNDFYWKDDKIDDCGIEFKTNLPWEIYLSLYKK